MIIQIVIDIPKGFYEHVKGHKDIFTYGLINGEKIGEIIANGTPLPKGHGRLIDTNEITAFRELECNGHNIESLDEFTAIIEADKAERSDKE